MCVGKGDMCDLDIFPTTRSVLGLLNSLTPAPDCPDLSTGNPISQTPLAWPPEHLPLSHCPPPLNKREGGQEKRNGKVIEKSWKSNGEVMQKS